MPHFIFPLKLARCIFPNLFSVRYIHRKPLFYLDVSNKKAYSLYAVRTWHRKESKIFISMFPRIFR